MVSTYGQLQLAARRALAPTEGAEAASVAWELLSMVTERPVQELIAHRELYASEEIEEKLGKLVDRVAAGEPLAYILGEWSFYGMRLIVTPDVLIPRDDTMAVTDAAIRCTVDLPPNPRILDLCTGSGCIGLAIANRVKDARVTLGDISQAALRVAHKNVLEQKLGGRVNTLAVDAMKPATKFLGTFDLIVSNPPYVTAAEMLELEPSVRNFEPHLALDGGTDGLDFYRAILKNYTTALNPGGYICFEFGMGQQDAVSQLLRQWDYEDIECKRDLRGVTRAVVARKKKETEYGNEESGI